MGRWQGDLPCHLLSPKDLTSVDEIYSRTYGSGMGRGDPTVVRLEMAGSSVLWGDT